MKICPNCNIEHEKPGKFCSRSCGNVRVRSQEFKDRLSQKLKGKPNPRKGILLKERITYQCLTCRKDMTSTEKSAKKYCSGKCNPNYGGYREGSGRSKTGYYKGIYCGSTYELVWVIYQLDHGFPFSRFEGGLESDGRKYYPDFIQNGVIIEIKGIESQDEVDRKTKIANDNGYEVKVLRFENLETEFEWVHKNYTKTNLHMLYDGYKPRYNYICYHCNSNFDTDKKKPYEIVFCSRVCAGKGHRGRKSTP